MTRNISSNDMATIRRSLADAGIYFDKLYINQAYFNSNITIQTTNPKTKKSNVGFWQKLLCARGTKQSSAGTQTALTVRDDSELKPPPVVAAYDRRRHRPLHRDLASSNNQQHVRRRRSSLVTRSVQMQRPKQMHDGTEDENDEFAV